MPAITERAVWWAADSGELPTAAGWTGTGTATVTLGDDAVRIVTAAAAYTLGRPVVQGDPPSLSRRRDTITVQLRIRARTLTLAWDGNTAGIWVKDGSRQLILAIGDRLQFVHPATGEIMAETEEAYPWSAWTSLRLEKRADVAWTAYQDGRKVLEVPYLLAPTLPSADAAQVFLGTFDPSATVDLDLDRFEVGLNLAPPMQWLVDKAQLGLPVAVRREATEATRAVLRAITGAATSAWHAALQLIERRGAADLPIERATFDGLQDPQTLRDPWTASDPATVSLLRQRVRIDGPGATATLYRDFAATPLPEDAHHALKVRGLIVRETTTSGWDTLGPYLELDSGRERVFAVLVDLLDGGYGWALMDAPPTSGAATLGEPAWRVDIRQPVDLELHLLGDGWAVLVVNGQIVNRVPTSSLASSAGHLALVGVDGSAAVIELDGATAIVSCACSGSRPDFSRWLQQHLLPVGGCERNDEMGLWLHHMQGSVQPIRPRAIPTASRAYATGVQSLRGGERGIVLELRRLTCEEDCYVVVEEAPAAWFVGVSFPAWTPIYISAAGYIRSIYVEFSWGPPGLSFDATVAWCAAYLVPISTAAATFWISLITKINGASSTPSAGLTRYPVTSTRFFTAGDELHLREDGATTHEAVTLVAVNATTLDVTTPSGTYTVGDFLRLPVRRT